MQIKNICEYYDCPDHGQCSGEGMYCFCPAQEINGAVEENKWLKFLIKSVVDSLPYNKDWLDPDIEKAMRGIIK